jgi:hypothetical protein
VVGGHRHGEAADVARAIADSVDTEGSILG